MFSYVGQRFLVVLRPQHKIAFLAVAWAAIAVLVVITSWSIFWPQWQAYRAVQALIHCVAAQDTEFNSRLDQAIDGIKRVQGGKPAVPFLIRALKRGKQEEREVAVMALAEIGPNAEAAVPALIDAMSGTTDLSMVARLALGRIGPRASAAVPILLSDLQSQDPDVRVYGAAALCKIDDQSFGLAIKALVEVLDDPHINALHREEAAQQMGELGDKALPCVPALLRAVLDDDGDLSTAAAEALKRIDPNASMSAGNG